MKEKIHLLTRPELDSLIMQRKLSLSGIKSVINPLIDIIFLPRTIEEFFAEESLNNCAIIITSLNSLRAIKRFETIIPKTVDFLIAGDVSHQQALTMKLGRLVKVGENSQDVLKYFLKEKPKYQKIYYLSGSKISLNLEISLQEQGFSSERRVIYDSQPQKLSKETLHYFRNSQIFSISLFSSYSAEIFCQEIEKHQLEKSITNLKLFTISEEIARIAKDKFLSQNILINSSYKSDDMINLILEQHS